MVFRRQPSVFDGDTVFDTLTANQKPLTVTGYRVNLEEHSFSFTNFERIATVKNFSHTKTCAETDDVIFSNSQRNSFNGKVGYNTLKALGEMTS